MHENLGFSDFGLHLWLLAGVSIGLFIPGEMRALKHFRLFKEFDQSFIV